MSEQTWERRTLGKTGLEVTALGIGCAWIGHRGGGDYDPEVGVQTVLAGLAAGINLVDTSRGAAKASWGKPWSIGSHRGTGARS